MTLRLCRIATIHASLLLAAAVGGLAQSPVAGQDISLNGVWETGLNRQYTQKQIVPGLAQDPSKPSPGVLWYRRSITLPAGDWQVATLTLNGARFAPQVYVNGEKVSSSAGGMAPTVHLLRSAAVAPGKTITLEIALASLSTLDPHDASSVPGADRFRTNISSGLWDSVTLHLSGATRLTRITPFTDFEHDAVAIHWQAEGKLQPGTTVRARILDQQGKEIGGSSPAPVHALNGVIALALHHTIQPWTPEHPNVYRLALSLSTPQHIEDQRTVSWGLKNFRAQNKHFYLNDEPITLRGGTVVWQRFLRTPEASSIAFDPAWFQRNVMLRLKSYGANTLRFHLGLPPEELLDLCDRDGLMVQMEWPFFHGISASVDSMEEQWQEWLDVAMRHPSIMIVHGWNETGGPELEKAWTAMNAVLTHYPPLVVAHRDTLHIHKYWWSLFENLGLYYDSADQFDRTIMVDEFGGNYLDQNGDPGLYPAVKETFLRFLGRDQTRDLRLEFHAESNARVGEYWRRIDAAGILPFCIMGSPQDGSSWFLGPLKDPEPMPVWDALAATFAPQSVSLDIWDRNFTPSQSISVPLHFFNDTSAAATLTARIEVRSIGEHPRSLSSQLVTMQLPAHGHLHKSVMFELPHEVGDWQLAATLENPVEGVTHPIVSSWNVRTLAPAAPPPVQQALFGVADDEPELKAFLSQNHLRSTNLDDPAAALLLTSAHSWQHLTRELRANLDAAVQRGASVVMLDIGPRDLGQGYRKGDLGPLDGTPVIKPGEGYVKTQDLFGGIRVVFSQIAEPESHIQPGPDDESLWQNLPRPATWIWDGLRGGLIAPAADMEVSGLSPAGLLAQWAARGANPDAIAKGRSFVYQLAGYYAYSNERDDKVTIDALRKRVKFLAEDAPALQAVLNPNAPIGQTDLSAAYRAASGQAQQLLTLSTCGKGLTRTSIVELTFGPGRGNVILSQALTAGRLERASAPLGSYEVRYDPAAEQFVLNMLAKALSPASAH